MMMRLATAATSAAALCIGVISAGCRPINQTIAVLETKEAGGGGAVSPADLLIAGRRYVRSDQRANTYKDSAQEAVAVAEDPAGRAVVVWQSRRQEEGGYGIYAQQFDAAGGRLGGEIHINRCTPGTQSGPAVVMEDRGGTWVVWESFAQDGDRGSIVARHFDQHMRPLTGEIGVNHTTEGHQAEAALAALPGGGAVVAWTSEGHGGSGLRIFARRLGPDGSRGSETIVVGTDRAAGHDRQPCVGVAGDGRSVIVWGRTDRAGRPLAVLGQRFDASGSAAGGEFEVSPPDGNMHLEPALAIAADGAFAVAWATALGGGYGIHLRCFGPDGVPAAPLRVDQGEYASTTGVGLAMGEDRRCVVAWSSCGDIENSTGLFARVYGWDGRSLSDPFRVTAAALRDQRLCVATSAQRVVCGRDGHMTFAWSGDAGLGDGNGAHITRISPIATSKGPLASPGCAMPAARPP